MIDRRQEINVVKRALVLRFQVHALTGVHNDTDRVVALLTKRGFQGRDIDVRREGRSPGKSRDRTP